MPNKIKVWLLATRAEMLIVSICPIIIGACIAFKEAPFNTSVFLLTLLYGIFMHLGTNLSNDYYDYLNGADTDKRVAPFSSIQKKLTSLKQIKSAYRLCFFLGFLIGLTLIFRGGLIVASLFWIPIIFGLYYTAGPRPLGYMGLGEISVLIFFGPFACLGTYYLQTLNITIMPIIAGFAPGFLSTAILIVNNLRDVKVDKPANKITLAVRYGKKFAQTEYATCMFMAFLIPVVYFGLSKQQLVLSSSMILLLAPYKIIYKFKNPSTLNNGIQKTVAILVIYTIVFCLSLFL